MRYQPGGIIVSFVLSHRSQQELGLQRPRRQVTLMTLIGNLSKEGGDGAGGVVRECYCNSVCVCFNFSVHVCVKHIISHSSESRFLFSTGHVPWYRMVKAWWKNLTTLVDSHFHVFSLSRLLVSKMNPCCFTSN